MNQQGCFHLLFSQPGRRFSHVFRIGVNISGQKSGRAREHMAICTLNRHLVLLITARMHYWYCSTWCRLSPDLARAKITWDIFSPGYFSRRLCRRSFKFQTSKTYKIIQKDTLHDQCEKRGVLTEKREKRGFPPERDNVDTYVCIYRLCNLSSLPIAGKLFFFDIF